MLVAESPGLQKKITLGARLLTLHRTTRACFHVPIHESADIREAVTIFLAPELSDCLCMEDCVYAFIFMFCSHLSAPSDLGLCSPTIGCPQSVSA